MQWLIDFNAIRIGLVLLYGNQVHCTFHIYIFALFFFLRFSFQHCPIK